MHEFQNQRNSANSGFNTSDRKSANYYYPIEENNKKSDQFIVKIQHVEHSVEKQEDNDNAKFKLIDD